MDGGHNQLDACRTAPTTPSSSRPKTSSSGGKRTSPGSRAIHTIYYLAPNTSACEWLSDDIKNEPAIFIDREIFGKSEVVDDLGEEGNKKYAKLWDEIKAAPVD